MLTLGEVAGQLPPCQILNPLFYLRHESVRLTVVLWRKVIKSDPWHTAWMLGLKALLLQPKKKPLQLLLNMYSHAHVLLPVCTNFQRSKLSNPLQHLTRYSCYLLLANRRALFIWRVSLPHFWRGHLLRPDDRHQQPEHHSRPWAGVCPPSAGTHIRECLCEIY